MIPIRDHNPSGRTPYVTWALIAANLGIFLAMLPLFGAPRQLMGFYMEWGVVPARIAAGAGLETLLTSQFLHGGWLHLGFNMLFLWIFGDNMEEEWGHLRFALFYLGCGVAAGLAQVAADPGSGVPMVGASGAVAGVLGGYLLMFPRARVDLLFWFIFIIRIVPVPAWLMLGAWFALQVLGGMTMVTDAGGVAYWAHAGGFVAGLVATVPVWLRRGGVAYWGRNFGHPPHPEARYRLVRTSVPAVRRRAGTPPAGKPPGHGPWGTRSIFPRVLRRRRR